MILLLPAMVASQVERNAEDARLLARVKERDQTALGELYDRYAPLVQAIALKVVKDVAEADDLAQEVFVQIWNKASLFAVDKGSPYTWIVTITRRKAIDRLRSKELINRGAELGDRAKFLTIEDTAYLANPLHAAINSEYDALMRNGLAQLSLEQRSIIEMSYYEGFTQQQISRQLQVPLGTVKTRMRQGLLALRDILRKDIE